MGKDGEVSGQRGWSTRYGLAPIAKRSQRLRVIAIGAEQRLRGLLPVWSVVYGVLVI